MSLLNISSAATSATVAYNANPIALNSLNSFMSTGGIVLVAGVIIALIGAVILLANPRVFAFAQRLWKRIEGSGELFVYGLAGYAAVALVATPVFVVGRETSQGNPWPLAGIGIAIGGYAVTAMFGWLVKNWWLKVKRNATPRLVGRKVTA
jgi:hypothetical protein